MDNNEKIPPIIPFEDFDEDWEEFEETPDYTFLKNLHTFLLSKSHPSKCTRRFLRDAMSYVKKGEVSQISLDDYIENEELNPLIVAEMKKKKLTKPTKYTQSEDPCGGGYTISSC